MRRDKGTALILAVIGGTLLAMAALGFRYNIELKRIEAGCAVEERK